MASRAGYVFRKPPDGERPRGRLAFIYSDKQMMMRGELESNAVLIRDCPVILAALRDAYAEIDRLTGERP